LFVQLFVVVAVAVVDIVVVVADIVVADIAVVDLVVVEIAVAAAVGIVAAVEAPFVSFEPSDLLFQGRLVFRPKMIKYETN